jgi:hypothetical protein
MDRFREPFIEPFMEPFIEPFMEPFIEPFMEPFMEPFIEPFMEPFMAPLMEPFMAPFIEPFMTPFIDPFMEPFIAPFSALFMAPFSIPFTTELGRIGDDQFIWRAGGSLRLMLVPAPRGMLKFAPLGTCIYPAGICRFPLACIACISWFAELAANAIFRVCICCTLKLDDGG